MPEPTMTLLGFILGSEPLAQAWRDVGESPLAARSNPLRRGPVRLAFWVLCLLLPLVWEIAYAVQCVHVLLDPNIHLALHPSLSFQLYSMMMVLLAFVIPVVFIVLRGVLPSRPELEEWAATPLPRELLTVAMIVWPVRTGFVLLPVFLIGTVCYAGGIFVEGRMMGRESFSGDDYEMLFNAVAITITMGWVWICGMLFCAGAACRMGRFLPILAIVWPIAMLVPILLCIGAHFAWDYLLATAHSWDYSSWFNVPEGPILSGAVLHLMTYVATLACAVVVLCRISLGPATWHLWAPLEESPQSSRLAFTRERFALGNRAARRVMSARAKEIAAHAPAAELVALAAGMLWLPAVPALATILTTAQGGETLAAAYTRTFNNFVGGLFCPSFILPVCAVVWSLLASGGRAGGGAHFSAPAPVGLALLTQAHLGKLMLLHFAMCLLFAHRSFGTFQGGVTDAPLGLCIAFMLGQTLGAAALLSCSRRSAATAVLWVASLTAVAVGELLFYDGGYRTGMLASAAQVPFMVFGGLALTWLLFDLLPSIANELWREHREAGASGEDALTPP